MPSDSETLGFVVLESMASGVPVVGANAGGIPSIVTHGVDSYLAEPGNIDEFVKCLNIIRENKDGVNDKMKVACRKEAEKVSFCDLGQRVELRV
jgi:sulfoquinovosyltransferase